MIFRRRRKPESVRHAPRCSFCGKERGAEGGGGRRVEMVAGPGVYICSDCISLCNEILNRRGHTPPSPA